MNVLVWFLGALACYFLAYRIYGRYVSRAMGQVIDRPTPAHELADNKDFVPTRPSVLFAHHYSTIAGAGPIVGPALGLLYGIGPAWLWVVFGAIFFGAVHDFAALFASIRQRGRSMAEIARNDPIFGVVSTKAPPSSRIRFTSAIRNIGSAGRCSISSQHSTVAKDPSSYGKRSFSASKRSMSQANSSPLDERFSR